MPGKWTISRLITVVLFLTVFSAMAAGADIRFVHNGDGTVTDTKTGLMWAQTDNMGHITWHDAKRYCDNIILSEHNNWRMPTADELKTFFDGSMDSYETICGHHIKSAPQVELSCGFVWSSEVLAVPGGYSVQAKAFNFAKGYWYSARMSQYRGYRALPVRNIEE
ncbi:MAG: DUF1566 domain-containing protein [bacterium]|nr:DUF1566 domain-containing protein [bacterium]